MSKGETGEGERIATAPAEPRNDSAKNKAEKELARVQKQLANARKALEVRSREKMPPIRFQTQFPPDAL